MRKIVFTAIMSCMFVSPAQAATIFTDRAAFDAATVGSASQSFPAAFPSIKDGKVTLNNVTFVISKAGEGLFVQDTYFQGVPYLATGIGGSVTISSTLNAFGLYLGSGDGAISFGYNAGGTTGTIKTLARISNGGTFIGFSDTSPFSVTFNTGNFREFDIVSYVTTANPVVTPPTTPGGPGSGGPGPIAGAVPEPGTWAMMILGFGLVGGVMRRRQFGTAPVVRCAA